MEIESRPPIHIISKNENGLTPNPDPGEELKE